MELKLELKLIKLRKRAKNSLYKPLGAILRAFLLINYEILDRIIENSI